MLAEGGGLLVSDGAGPQAGEPAPAASPRPESSDRAAGSPSESWVEGRDGEEGGDGDPLVAMLRGSMGRACCTA